MKTRSHLILRISVLAGMRELFGGATLWVSIGGLVGWIIAFTSFYSGYSRLFKAMGANALRQHFWSFHILFSSLLFLGALAAFLHKTGNVTEEHILRSRGVTVFEASLGTITQGTIFFLLLLALLLPAGIAFVLNLEVGTTIVVAISLSLITTVFATSAAAFSITVLIRSKWAIGHITKALSLVTLILGYSLIGVSANWIDPVNLSMYPGYGEPTLGALFLLSAVETALALSLLKAGILTVGGDALATGGHIGTRWDVSRIAPILARLAPPFLEQLVIKDLRLVLRSPENFALFLINWGFIILPGAFVLRNTSEGPFRMILTDILLMGTIYQVCVFIGSGSVLSDRGMLWLLRTSDPNLTRWLGGKFASQFVLISTISAAMFLPLCIIGMIPIVHAVLLGLVSLFISTLLSTGLSCLPLAGWPVPVVLSLGLCTTAAILSNSSLIVLNDLVPKGFTSLTLFLIMIWAGTGVASVCLGRYLLVSKDLRR